MGFKRPFDCEDFQELPFKQARQVDYSNKMTQFADLYRTTSEETDVTDDQEGSFGKSQEHESSGNNCVSEASKLVKDFGIAVPWSLVTSNSVDDDVGSRFTAYSSDFLEHEFDVPRRLEASDDAYFSYLDSSPRKQVPLGPNHQASSPLFGKRVNKNRLEWEDTLDPGSSSLSESDLDIHTDNEEKFLGTCIIPMPDTETSADNSDEIGGGRKDCSCMDEGSGRCVQQHIMEARESLLKFLGHEQLVHLGFCEMGEEVTHKWTKEEERVFHAVVNSNPASLGQNFWKHLSHVFSTRSTMEIVSYYFNVFMLRRRAVQNRSNFLDIDSDDDELHGINRGSFKARVLDEDDDSDIESFDQYDHADYGEDTLIEDGEDDDDDSDGDQGDSSGEATGEDSGVDNVSETPGTKSLDGSRFDVVNRAGLVGEDFTVQDNSCMSFEFQADTIDSCDPADTEVAEQGSRVRSHEKECFPGNGDGYSDGVDQVYLLDSCDAKAWDSRYTVPIKGVDFLPTCNIIEEIFGQGTSGDKK
ncbi:uncharacterized protein LOC8289127 [Ricinus communis]|uniref:uncharacterized protein LOC8289127 n=1 Tax=Ricinus communis TaxID=3988 RepID=UPI00201A6F1B|nr:uncharacterized protein LOC8289127 [Ricinus communis]XP_048232852.1 uncharacterized protein LOC8289127 [Ricinus communis]